MATLGEIQTYAAPGNQRLRQRFQAARIQAAWDILAEANGGTAPRAAWRLKIFKDTNADLDREYVWCLSHANIQNFSALPETTAGDAALLTATKSFVDAWAAVTWG